VVNKLLVFLNLATKNQPVKSLCGQFLLKLFSFEIGIISIKSQYFSKAFSITSSFSILFKVQVE